MTARHLTRNSVHWFQGVFLWLWIIVALLPAGSSVDAASPCPDFHFADSGFAAIERDYEPALLYVWPGDNSRAHGVAFLIDASASYYLTARHVVELSISNPATPVQGVDSNHHKLLLHIVAEDDQLDVALLKIDNAPQVSGVQPYELFLNNIGPEEVTFSGLAYSNENSFSAHPPKEDRFRYNEDATEMELRVNTDEGDSGAPVYTKQGVVVGMVTNKQKISQATAVTMRNLSDFISSHSMDVPQGSPMWQLHDFLLKTSDRRALVVKLTPAHIPGRVSNFQLLGAIRLILVGGEIPRLNHDFVYCPLVQAARDRGLADAAVKLEVAEARVEAAPPSNGPPSGSGSSSNFAASVGAKISQQTALLPVPKEWTQIEPAWQGLQYFVIGHEIIIVKPDRTVVAILAEGGQTEERVGDILMARANEWDRKGDGDFYQRLSREAQLSFRNAIAAHLQADKRPLLVFAEPRISDSPETDKVFAVNFKEILSRIGITASPAYASGDWLPPFNEPKQDDKFAALLNKYYEATIGAIGLHLFDTEPKIATAPYDPKVSAARNTAAAWATLMATSDGEKVKSWSFLADAMIKDGQPDEAARSIARAYKVQPTNKALIKNYVAAKKLQFGDTALSNHDVWTAVDSESPLTRTEVVKFGLSGAM
jgi:hypothetical protein